MGKRFYAKESTDIKMTMILPTAFVFLWALPCHFQSLFRILVIDFKAAVCKFAHIDLSGPFLFETSLCLCLKNAASNNSLLRPFLPVSKTLRSPDSTSDHFRSLVLNVSCASPPRSIAHDGSL